MVLIQQLKVLLEYTSEPNQAPYMDVILLITAQLPHDNVAGGAMDIEVSATATDPDADELVYVWSDSNGVVAEGSTAVLSLVAGDYLFTCTATDSYGASDSRELQVTINPEDNFAPLAADLEPELGDIPHNNHPDMNSAMFLICGAGSDDDGDDLTYQWTDNNEAIVTGQADADEECIPKS